MNQILIAPRRAGKTTWLLTNLPKNTLVVSNYTRSIRQVAGIRTLFDVVTPKYLLECFENRQFLDWGVLPESYDHYLFDEPSNYWYEFATLWNKYLPNANKKASYTPLSITQYEFNPGLTIIDRVTRTMNH